jgi:hypothetical protein
MPPAFAELERTTWASLDVAERDLRIACQTEGFGISVSDSRKNTDGVIISKYFKCWRGGRSRLSAKQQANAAARASDPNIKTRKRTCARTDCQWAGSLRLKYHTWYFEYHNNNNAHNHPFHVDAAKIPSNKRRIMQELDLTSEILSLSKHFKLSCSDIVDGLGRKYPDIRIDRHTVMYIITKDKEKTDTDTDTATVPTATAHLEKTVEPAPLQPAPPQPVESQPVQPQPVEPQ